MFGDFYKPMSVMKERLRLVCANLLPLIGIGGGIYALSFGSVNLWQSIRCKSWPHADGIIRNAKSEKESSRRYSVGILYDYEVGGISYTGTRAVYWTGRSAKEEAQSFVEHYPPDKRVTVFYPPTHPEDPLLDPGIFGGTSEQFDGIREQLGVGAVFLIGCVALLIARRKLSKKSR